MKSPGLTWGVHVKLLNLSAVEESGIPSVAVKCVDIRRNTSGEGGLLDDEIMCEGTALNRKKCTFVVNFYPMGVVFSLSAMSNG